MFLLQFLRLFGLPLLFVLLPLGLYLLALATINRRSRPLLVSGAWDAVGLLFAASGFFLVLVPVILDELYYRALGTIPAEGPRGLTALWARYGALWALYYAALVLGGALLIVWRGRKSLIYNIEFEKALHLLQQLRAGPPESRTHAAAGDHAPVASTGIQEEVSPTPAAVAVLPALEHPTNRATEAAFQVEPFALGYHVTLTWPRAERALRAEIETELRRRLAPLVTHGNPIGGWLLVASGFIFGLITLVALLFITTPILQRRF